ncbi:MAG: HAD-IC family P-type ATPase [Chlamydiia bacterium]|nr:HAD-IC family P-type ATPase [Chlamydiia bacterium]
MPSHVNSEDIFKKYTTSSKGLTSAEVERRRGVYGWNRISEKRKSLILIVLKYFWGPIPWMIEIAAILSLLIEHYMDFCLIAVLLLFNGFIAFWQEHQAANAIEALKKQLALKCRALRDGAWSVLPADSLVPGDIIKLRLGDIIPADAIGVDGEYLTINQSALTGESLSVTKGAGELLYSGAIINQGEMVAVVVATGEKTYFGHTMKLVESAGARSRFQESILLIGRYLICLSVALIVGLFVVQILKGDSPLHFLKFALILLVASIPVAMPAVLSMAMAVGALKLSHSGAIVTRLESIEELAGIDVLCCDKTGTLTRNELTIGEVVCSEGVQREDLLFYAATASKNEDFDSIDDVIIKGLGDPSRLEGLVTSEYTPFDPKRKRTEARVNASSGESYRTSKGAPQVILDLCGFDGDE